MRRSKGWHPGQSPLSEILLHGSRSLFQACELFTSVARVQINLFLDLRNHLLLQSAAS